MRSIEEDSQLKIISNTLYTAQDVLHCAKLQNAAPNLYGLSMELKAINIVISEALEKQDQGNAVAFVLNDVLTTNYGRQLLESTSYAFEKINEDPALSRMINDRIAKDLRLPKTVNENDELAYPDTYVQSIKDVATHMPFINQELDTGDTDMIPGDSNKQTNDLIYRDLGVEINGLKGQLAMESRARG